MNSSHAEQAVLMAAANDNLKKQIQDLGTQLKEDQAFVEQTNKLISVYELVHKQDKAIIDQQNVIIAARDEKIAALGRQEVKKPNCKPTRKGSEKRMLRTLVRLAEKLKANGLLTIYYTKKLEEWTELLNDENVNDVDGVEESSGEKPNCEAPAENLATAVVMSEEAAVPSDAPPSPASEKSADEKEPEATEEAASSLKENIYVFEPLNTELTAAAEENLIPKDVDGEAAAMNDTPVSLADPQSAEAGAPPAGGDRNEAVDIFDEDLFLPYDTPETLSAAEEMDTLAFEMEEAVQAGDSATGCAHQDAAVQEEAEEPNPSTTGKANDEFEDGEDDWMELSDNDSVCDVSMTIDEEAADTEGEEQELSDHQEAPEKETAGTQQVIPTAGSQAESENKSQGESAPPVDADKVDLDLLQAENDGVPAKIVEDQVSHLVSTDFELASLWDTHEEIETQSLALEVPAERAADAPSTLQSSDAEDAEVQNTEEDEEMVQPKKVLKRKSGALEQKGCPKKAKKSWKYSPGKTDTPQPSPNCSRKKIDDEAPDAMGRPGRKKTLGRNKRLLDYPEIEVQRRKKNKQRSQREGINRKMKMLVGQLCGFTVTNL